MRRSSNWPRRLMEYIERNAREPFAWGEHDCALFAAGAVHAMTGEDPMEAIRGTYSDESGAEDAIASLSARGLYGALTEVLGASVVGAQGKRGDIAYHNGICGVVMGRDALFVSDEGLIRVPIRQVQRAFHVG